MYYKERDEKKRQEFLNGIEGIAKEDLVYVDESGIDEALKLARKQTKPKKVLRTGKDTEARVKEIICEQLGVGVAEVMFFASFIEDLGADSLDIVELVMALEEEYNTEISDEEAEKIRTVRDVITYIESRKE